MKRVLPLALCMAVAVFMGAFLFTSAAMAINTQPNVRFAVHAAPGHPTPTKGSPPEGCPELGGIEDPVTLGIPCSEYTTQVSLPQYPGPWCYIVVGQGDPLIGIGGASFGIYYKTGSGAGNGIDESIAAGPQFEVCTDGLLYPGAGWPHPGSGIRMTYGTCRKTVVDPDGVQVVLAKVYCYAYSDDTFEIIPNPVLETGNELTVADCPGGGGDTYLLNITAPSLHPMLAGRVQFGGGSNTPYIWNAGTADEAFNSSGYTPCGVVLNKPSTWGKIKTLFETSGE